ncbi:flagellar basal body P-ring protein FlgI [Chitinimonas sp. BJB300]|uniref:flagellar basal body P-ring protein FlgI n=1 Tax=Chitinimonas sp. BJB300 TaxID=1559339 RepID=UPI000C0D2A9B|nr:flagellar basal body P-ring protein FlgI [Chitinimonas sp. BJB300]PHV11239.1 flagellar biosynthesis protein FlgI [Chitinimonas sp. BJB300]TSJ88615.1 flagellar basal body P-ring protein FlgI [Chitinimonas sp. BJB300]
MRIRLTIRLLICSVLVFASFSAQAQKLKELVSVGGVRNNQLLGYGLVVGLDGSGDQTSQTPFTTQSLTNMLQQLGVTLPAGTKLQLKNVAAVSLTANLPAFSRIGQSIDVVVSSMGNAKSLRGGTLLMSPLKGADGRIYAVAQGNVIVAGAGAAAGGSSTQVNQLSVGRIPDGATVEREVPGGVGAGENITLALNNADFSTANRVAQAINANMGSNTARALDARTIQVQAPQDPDGRVAFMAKMENLSVTPEEALPKVVINARTGSIVMNRAVTLEPCAISHGNLTVTITASNDVSQPKPLSNGTTTPVQNATVDIKAEKGGVTTISKSVSLNEVARALNKIGATPQDLLAILQAMKAAGALKAELEVI